MFYVIIATHPLVNHDSIFICLHCQLRWTTFCILGLYRFAVCVSFCTYELNVFATNCAVHLNCILILWLVFTAQLFVYLCVYKISEGVLMYCLFFEHRLVHNKCTISSQNIQILHQYIDVQISHKYTDITPIYRCTDITQIYRYYTNI